MSDTTIATPPEDGDALVRYRNHRGEVAARRIRPMRWFYGRNEWHLKPGWLCYAWADVPRSTCDVPSAPPRSAGETTASDSYLPCPFCGGAVDPRGWCGYDSHGPACVDCGAMAQSREQWGVRFVDESLVIPIDQEKA